MKILYLKKGGISLTGSGTYQDLLLAEIEKHHQIKIYNSPAVLDNHWDLAHALDIKHLPIELMLRLKCPLIVDIHDHYWTRFYPFFSPDFPLRFLLQKYRKVKYQRILKKAAAIVTHSRCVFEAVKHPRKFVVHYGVDLKLFKKDESAESRGDIILFIGRDYLRKGILTLFRALPLILKDIPTVRVVIVGSEFWHSRMITKILSVNLPVEFTDGLNRKKLIRYYQKSRVFALPSKIEAFGISILEAMAAGIPVVAARVGGIPEIITNGESGLLFKRGDYRELAQMVVLCMKDEKMREKLVGNGLEVVKGNFTIKNMIKEINRVYSKVLEG